MEFEVLYNSHYVNKQLEKFRNRHSNHWAPRIKIVFDMIENQNLNKGEVLDLGCSIGTYAYEFASRGFSATGVDLSEESIDVARKIAEGDNLKIDYKISDISHKDAFKANSFDIVYAGDIVEHLLDDVLLSTLQNCHHWLREDGTFMVHTVPTKFDKIFHKSRLWMMLIPFFWLPDFLFKKVVECQWFFFNFFLKVFTGKSWLDRERETVHCNLQSKKSLVDMLKKAGFYINDFNLSIVEDRFKQGLKFKLFGKKEYYQKDIYIVCSKTIQ